MSAAGTAFYARWLTERGYTVHLIDVVPAHVEAARTHRPAPASASIGDARRLPWPDATRTRSCSWDRFTT
jgi:hypothetical protein